MQRAVRGGMATMLAGIHPSARWRNQVLEISSFPDEEMRLDGRGLRLQPSYFCWETPDQADGRRATAGAGVPDPARRWAAAQGRRAAGSTQEHLAALLGRTRATVLALTVDRLYYDPAGRGLQHHPGHGEPPDRRTTGRRADRVAAAAEVGDPSGTTELGHALLEAGDPWSRETDLHESRLPSSGPIAVLEEGREVPIGAPRLRNLAGSSPGQRQPDSHLLGASPLAMGW